MQSNEQEHRGDTAFAQEKDAVSSSIDRIAQTASASAEELRQCSSDAATLVPSGMRTLRSQARLWSKCR